MPLNQISSSHSSATQVGTQTIQSSNPTGNLNGRKLELKLETSVKLAALAKGFIVRMQVRVKSEDDGITSIKIRIDKKLDLTDKKPLGCGSFLTTKKYRKIS